MSRLARWFGPELRLTLAFLCLGGVLAYLGHGYSRRVDANHHLAQASAQQRVQLQRILRWLTQVSVYTGEAREQARVQLATDFAYATQIMTALRDGGTLTLGQQPVTLARGRMPEGASGVARQLDELWQQFAARTSPIASNGRTLDDAQLQRALEYASETEGELTRLATELGALIEADADAAQQRITWLELAGFILAAGFFSFLLFLYARELRKVRTAQKETNDILQTVPAGLFLLDPQLRLGDQHSAQLTRILQRENLAGADFYSILSGMVAPETLLTARDYIQLLLGDRVNEHLVASLNPLDEVEAQLPGESGRLEKRWLGFTFRRVLEQGRLSHLLVTVTDVTDRVLLARRLEQAEAASDQQAERLLDLFLNLTHVEYGLLEARLERWERLLRESNEVLKRQAATQDEFHQLINQVFRPIHALKGEAAALDLGVIVQRAAAVERELADLRTRDLNLTGNDFLPVTVRLEDLFAQFDAVRKVTRRLFELSRGPRAAAAAGPVAPAPMAPPAPAAAPASRPAAAAPAAIKPGAQIRASAWDMARELCRRTAHTMGKRADLELAGLDDALVPEHLRQPLLDVVMQLVRNAVAHGIEVPDERKRQGKSDTGHLSARFQRQPDGGFELQFRDDGRGIDFERIRERAVALGKVSAAVAQGLEARQLAALIFEPGFSTADLPGDSAGRGVGLDLVRERIRRLGGQIGVSTGPGQYTQFKIRLPAAVPTP